MPVLVLVFCTSLTKPEVIRDRNCLYFVMLHTGKFFLGSMQMSIEYVQTQFAYYSAKLPIVVLLPCNVYTSVF